jgi:small subunit ribosomal protein S18
MPPKKKRKPRKDKPCPICSQGIEYIDYKDLALLKPFLNERARIKGRRTTGACAKCQSRLSDAVKNAREMALIPYTAR